MPQFEVVADKLWHSTDCKVYQKGDIVELPEGSKGDSIKPYKEPKQKAPAKSEDLA